MADPVTWTAIAAVATVGSTGLGAYSAMTSGDGGGGGAGGARFILPPELEAQQLAEMDRTLASYDQSIAEAEELLPFIEQRADYLYQSTEGIIPQQDALKQIEALDRSIAERFGTDVAADVQVGLVTDAAKQQAVDLASEIRREMEAQGKVVDDQAASDIMGEIRRRMAEGDGRIESIQDQLMEEMRATGEPIPEKDPRVEAEISQKRAEFEDRMSRELGPDWRQTTGGRKALVEFNSGVTQTRFAVRQQLKQTESTLRSQKAQRLTSLASSAFAAEDQRNQNLQTNIAGVRGVQDILTGRVQRLVNFAKATQENINTASASLAPEYARQRLNMERAQTAMNAGQNLRNFYGQSLQYSAAGMAAKQMPLSMRNNITQMHQGKMGIYRDMSQQQFTEDTLQAMRAGRVGGIEGYRDIHDGAFQYNYDKSRADYLSRTYGDDVAADYMRISGQEGRYVPAEGGWARVRGDRRYRNDEEFYRSRYENRPTYVRGNNY